MRWVKDMTHVHRDPGGAAESFQGIIVDITARKEFEERLAFAMATLNQIQDLVTTTDLEGNITYLNDAACRMLKRDREDLIGQHVSTLGEDPVAGATQADIIRRTREEGHWRGEVVNTDAHGGRIVLDCRTQLLLDDQGNPTGMCGVSTDITEMKRAVEALRVSEERLRTLVDNGVDQIVVHDLDGRILHANRSTCQVLGLSLEEVKQLTVRDIDAGVAARSDPERIWRRLGPNESAALETQCRRSDGSVYPAEVVLKRFEWDGQPAIMASARDLTERKQLEAELRQAQKMQAVGRLAAGVAHDFNNQLQVISGYCEMLLQECEPDEASREMLTEVQHAADRAQSTTSHLLAFSRRQILEPVEVDLADFFGEIEKPLGRLLGEDVKLSLSMAPGVWPVLIDRSGLHQAIMNTAVNARDAMPGGGRLTVRVANVSLDSHEANAYPDAAPGDYVLLEVSDTGSGMDAETAEHLFEPFFTTKGPGRGTGLGMSMVQGFVRQSRGFVRVDSTLGQGTTVRILLPPHRVRAAAEPDNADADSVSPTGGGQTILIVEDEPGVRTYLASVLSRAGYKVLAASSPSMAIRMVTDLDPKPDLILTDVVMPEMRGGELADMLRARYPSLRFVFVSGYTDTDLDGYDVVRKPFAIGELLSAISRELG